MNLAGQVALVTGGGRGIGRSIAAALAGAGVRVAVASRSENELAYTVNTILVAGGSAVAIPADISDPAAVGAMVHEVEEKLGPINLLVNNAATGGPFRPVSEVEPAGWWRCFEINLRGAFLCAHAVLGGMLSRGSGRMIHVASGAGTFPIANMSAYATSKTALIRFSEILALEAGPRGVASFSISPGTVRTAMAEDLLNDPQADRLLPWFRQSLEEGRDVPPEVAAQLVLRLASGRYDELSGCFLHIEDDLDLLLSRTAEIRRGQLYSLRLRKVQ